MRRRQFSLTGPPAALMARIRDRLGEGQTVTAGADSTTCVVTLPVAAPLRGGRRSVQTGNPRAASPDPILIAALRSPPPRARSRRRRRQTRSPVTDWARRTRQAPRFAREACLKRQVLGLPGGGRAPEGELSPRRASKWAVTLRKVAVGIADKHLQPEPTRPPSGAPAALEPRARTDRGRAATTHSSPHG